MKSLCRLVSIVAIAALPALAGVAAAQGVQVGWVPAVQSVTPGDSFELEVRVTEAGASFNAFDLVVGFDPAALTFVPAIPSSLQEGSYMTTACGDTYHLFSVAADTLKITDVLLCGGVSLTGPGQIYRLKFRAAAIPQVTQVQVRLARFFDAGVRVNPVGTGDATIAIGIPLGATPLAPPSRLALRGSPNPFRGRLQLSIEAPVAGEQRVEVTDVLGRRVRQLERGEFPAGARQLSWDGLDDQGRALPPGLYRVTVRGSSGTVTRMVSLLR